MDLIFVFSIIIILTTTCIVLLVGYLVKKNKPLAKTYQSLFVGVLAVLASTIAGLILLYGAYYESRQTYALGVQREYNQTLTVVSALIGEMNANIFLLTNKLDSFDDKAHLLNKKSMNLNFSDKVFNGLKSNNKIGEISNTTVVHLYNAYNWLALSEDSFFSHAETTKLPKNDIITEIYTACFALSCNQAALGKLVQYHASMRLTSMSLFQRANSWFNYSEPEIIQTKLTHPPYQVPLVCMEYSDMWTKEYKSSLVGIPTIVIHPKPSEPE